MNLYSRLNRLPPRKRALAYGQLITLVMSPLAIIFIGFRFQVGWVIVPMLFGYPFAIIGFAALWIRYLRRRGTKGTRRA